MAKEYDLITVVVEYGKADHIIAAAFNAGAQGATVHPARGIGVKIVVEGAADFGIDKDKEMVMVVTESGITDTVYEEMIRAGNLREWGLGFGYIQKVYKPVGFLKHD